MKTTSDSLAIIGLAGRFPQAPSVEALWNLLRRGEEAVTFFSDDELLQAGVDRARLADPRYVKARACLDGVEYFDAEFFGILPAEAARIDPQQRLFMECAWEALEHAGYGALAGRPQVGVFASASAPQYLTLLTQRLGAAASEPFALDGVLTDFLALRTAYKLDLRGPAVTALTACSSSLVSFHLACQSLLLGEADIALAGGVSVAVPARVGRLWQEGSIISRDGRCRPFDAAASGTVGGDAVAVVVLKRLDRALADGDFIHAVVRGSAVNNDGAAKIGFAAPSVDAQARVIGTALSVASVSPQDIGYVEAHGSGTSLGDPIEIAALAQAMVGAARSSIALGSIKANIGHTDAAAGICGVVKATLCLRERTLVPTPNFETPNPLAGLPETPFRVQTETAPWPGEPGTRLAGVTSLGMGGTNVHVVLQDAPAPEKSAAPLWPRHLLVVSARSRVALERRSTELAEYLLAHPGVDLADVAFTLQVGREPFRYRRCLVASDALDAARALAVRDPARVHTGEASAGRSVAFLFPGLGDLEFTGVTELYRLAAAFRAAIDHCSERFAPRLGCDLRELLAAPSADRLSRWTGRVTSPGLATRLAQPAMFAVSWAAHCLWSSIGVAPDVLAGYSLGEYVAAVVAGVFSLDDAIDLVAERASLIEGLPAGSMTAIASPAAQVKDLLGPGASIAAVTAKDLCVAAGTVEALVELEQRLDARSIPHRRLDVRHAFHTEAMAPLVPAFSAAFERVRRNAPDRPLYANVTGQLHDGRSACETRYWCDHVAQPIRFDAIVQDLVSDPRRVVLQVGTGSQLARLAKVATAGRRDGLIATSLPEDSGALEHWLSSIGRLWVGGVDIDWPKLDGNGSRRRLPLPTYPFERKRHWVDASAAEARPEHATAMAPAGGALVGSGEGATAREERRGDAAPLAGTPPPPAGPRQKERALLEVWRASFGFDHIGARDNFFELGGHSLLALQMLHRLRRSHGVDLSIRALIENPTISALAAHWETLATTATDHGLDRLARVDVEERARIIDDYVTGELAVALGRSADEVRQVERLSELGFEPHVADLIRVVKRDLACVVYPHEILACATARELGELLLQAAGHLPPGSTTTTVKPPETIPSAPAVETEPVPARPVGAARNPPIAFILSSARSGSTLLRVMLAGHPGLFCPPELHLLMFHTLKERQASLSSSHFGRGLSRALMEIQNVDLAAAEATVRGWVERDLTIPDVYRELQAMTRPRLFVDKSPSYAEDIATLRRMDHWFSASYAIVLTRHPFAVMESYVRNRIGTMASTRYADPWEQAERHWLTHNQNVLRLFDEAPRPAHWVKYEDLVADPEASMRALCASLGIRFGREVLTPYQGRRMIDGVGDPNFHEHDAISPELGEVWRRVRPPRPLLPETRRLAERLGYELA
jgi:phthiocerol/phenolphthiocerol synthesis type-I polyketide synthase E